MNNFQLVIRLKNGKTVYSEKSTIHQVLLWRTKIMNNLQSRDLLNINLKESTGIVPASIKSVGVIKDSKKTFFFISSSDVISCMFIEPLVHYQDIYTQKIYQFSSISNDFEVANIREGIIFWEKTTLNFTDKSLFIRLGKDSIL